MSTAILKKKIIKKLDNLDKEELGRFDNMLDMLIDTRNDDTNWENLPEEIKKRIDKSLAQADNGKLIPAGKVIAQIRKKFGLNE